MRIIPSAALLFAMLSTPAIAIDGNDLLRMCEQPELSHQRGVCNGFVLGVSSGIEIGGLKAGYAAGLPENQWDSIKRYGQIVAGYCEPEGVENSQLIDVVKKFLKDNPEHRHEDAAIVTVMAFTSAFPCP